MDIMLKLNPEHYEFFTPLVKWKILSVNDLYEQSEYLGRKNSFHKLINRFESYEVVKSVTDLWSRRKYLYLTKRGDDLINHTDHILGISEESLLHDMRLAEFTLAFQKYLSFNSLKFDHEWRIKGDYSTIKRNYADAVINAHIKKKSHNIAIELELNQKSKERILEKYQRYVATSAIDLCLYIFGKQSTMQSYHRLCMEAFKTKEAKKFIFFTLAGIEKGKFDLTQMQGLRVNSPLSLRCLLQGEENKNWMRIMGDAIKGGSVERLSTRENSCEFSAPGPDSPPPTKFACRESGPCAT